MKSLLSLLVFSLSSSLASASHLICSHGSFSPMLVDVQIHDSQVTLKILRSAKAGLSESYPQQGEVAVLKTSQYNVDSENWLSFETKGNSARGYELEIERAKMSEPSFTAMMTSSQLRNLAVRYQYQLTCTVQNRN